MVVLPEQWPYISLYYTAAVSKNAVPFLSLSRKTLSIYLPRQYSLTFYFQIRGGKRMDKGDGGRRHERKITIPTHPRAAGGVHRLRRLLPRRPALWGTLKLAEFRLFEMALSERKPSHWWLGLGQVEWHHDQQVFRVPGSARLPGHS